MRRLRALFQGRCPRCLEGRIWRAAFTMNEPCPVCGLQFEREPGYWTGAMVASYALGVPVLLTIVAVVWLLSRWDLVPVLLIADVAFLATVPFVWRYSRVVWLYLDWLVDPVR